MALAEDDEIDPLDAYMASLELPSAAPKAAGAPASPVVSATDWATARRGSRRKASDAQRAPPDANDIGSSGAVVKNRRYRRLQQLLQGEKVAQDLSQPGAMESNPDDWYFSDAMMQQRNPALFHFHLGQYLPAAAAASSNTSTQLDSSGIDAEELLFSSFLLSTNDRREMEVRRAFEQRTWGKFTGQDEKDARARERALLQQDQEEGEEEESNSEEEDDGGDEEMKQSERHEEAAENDVMSIAERRQVLVDLMVQRFLQGSDHQYVNYTEIDSNAALDDLEQMQRDAEDAYFDMEEDE